MNTLQYNGMTLAIQGTNYSITTMAMDTPTMLDKMNEFNIIHDSIKYNIKPNYKNGSFSNTYKLYLHYKPINPCSMLEVCCDYDTIIYKEMNIIGELYHGQLLKMSMPIHYIFYIIYNLDNITYHVAIDTSLKCQTYIQFYIETSYEQLLQLLIVRYNCKKINNLKY